MKSAHKILLWLGLLSVCAGAAPAQVVTGTPPFGSFSGGPVDTINLANLNAHISIPVVNKAGRGLPFSYNLGYDTSVWYPVGVSGSQTWQPVQNWGWISETEGATGSLDFTTTVYCFPVFGCSYDSTNFGYIDPFGVPHLIPLEAAGNLSTVAYKCNGTVINSYPGSCPSTDGSGYALVVNNVPPDIAITNPSGTSTIPPQNTNTGTAGETDSNGNQISVNGSGVFTDTLGQTALTIGGSGTPASPNTFTYTAPSGANAAYTMNYTNYTVATNFGVPGITEYKSSAAVSLVTSIVLPDGSQYTVNYESTPSIPASGACTPYAGTTCVTGRLTSIKLPTGGTITYSYSGGNNGILPDGTTATLIRNTPDTGSNYWTYAHTESGAAWTTTITDPSAQQNQTVMNFQTIYPTETQVYQGSSTSGTLLKTIYTCYNGSAAPCNSTAVTLPIAQKTTYKLWPGGLESEINTLYDEEACGNSNCSNGLAKENDEYAYGNGAPGSLVRKTLITYASLGNSIVGKPSQVTVKDASGNIKAQTTYCYDEGTPSGTTTCNAAGSPTQTNNTPQHVAVSGSRGNVTTIAQLASGSTTLGKIFTYYDTGNVNVATDVNGAQTTLTYGTGSCGNSFPTSVSEPLSLSESVVWNCTGGVATSITDENGQTVSTSYTDPHFWRPHSITDQLLNATNLTYNGDLSVETAMTFGSSTTDVLATVDSLGRPRFKQFRQSPSSTTYASSETDYDSLGRPSKTTLPYAGTAGQVCSGSCPGTITVYDPLGRPASVTDGGGGTISYSHTWNDISVTAGPHPNGENTKRRQLEYDGLGRLTSVCEITSATGSGTCGQNNPQTGYWTQYTYDVNNNLTGVTQNAQSGSTQTRTYAYDDLGRTTSETNPESGITNYTYDTDTTCGTSNGDLVKVTDALGNSTCYAYDTLHRVTAVTYPSGSYAAVTPSKHFAYDSATVNGVAMTNVKTRLAEAYTCYSPCSTKLTDEGFSYTARGESSDLYESTPHSGGYYHVNQTYWANGTTNQLSGLSGLPTITYGVDGEGRVYSANASSGQNPLASTTYNVASLPTAVNLGSSDGDSFGYDSNTNRMTQYSFNVNSQSVVGSLTWNAVGTLGSLGITDPFNGSNAQTCSYGHDDLVRIASANCGSVWSQTFSYDAFGNINKSGNISFSASYSSSTNRMTSIGSSTPTYDSNGNVTNDFLHTYAWDADGHPVTIDSVNVTYDALGSVVEQNRSGAYTEIVYTPAGDKLALMTGSTLQKGFVPLTGGTMAVYNSTGLAYYRHSDWIGSSRFASTPSRAMYSDGAYAPFGETYAQTGSTDLSFTGMNQDTVSNLYDFPAREYGIQGRWPSPDPAGISSVDPTDPQTWDRYAYVRNSPLTLTDPLGLDDGGGNNGCAPGDFTCIGSCGIYFCGSGPVPTIPFMPLAIYTLPGAPATSGLPSGIFATGPGIDYSWMHLLNWALGLPDPMPGMFGFLSPSVCYDDTMRLVTCDVPDPSGCGDQASCADSTTVGAGSPPPPVKPRSLLDKLIQTIACIAGLPPDYAKQDAGWGVSAPNGSTDTPVGHMNGQRTTRTNRGTQRVYNPVGGNSPTVDRVAGGVGHFASAAECMGNVWALPPKKQKNH
ncbi:MAG TPA: RHS repeat-associated core domain-containing protein [Candidatus Acidoferrales bacterium]|nr:RHS repeat-associated core domain-containing protein [Candidatus Acidoferrales bacterium]